MFAGLLVKYGRVLGIEKLVVAVAKLIKIKKAAITRGFREIYRTISSLESCRKGGTPIELGAFLFLV